ncbi:MAG: hypothetical protein AB2693_31835 [Candidatus Thiodiazotropha sp.]
MKHSIFSLHKILHHDVIFKLARVRNILTEIKHTVQPAPLTAEANATADRYFGSGKLVGVEIVLVKKE